MLRAVRFSAAFDFALDGEARSAIAEMAPEIHAVSPERIAMEMRRMLSDAGRAAGVRLASGNRAGRRSIARDRFEGRIERQRFNKMLDLLPQLGVSCSFPLALAAVLHLATDAAGTAKVCRRWKLSNKETERVCWLVEHHAALNDAETIRWSALQPILLSEGIEDLLTLMEASSPQGAEAAAHCRRLLERPRERLDPPPLVSGNDLAAFGIPSGPQYKTLLQRVRDAQLDEEVRSKEEALAMVRKLVVSG